MLIEEEEPKGGDINPDALEAVFVDETEIDVYEEVLVEKGEEDDEDEIDIAFAANDEGYW